MISRYNTQLHGSKVLSLLLLLVWLSACGEVAANSPGIGPTSTPVSLTPQQIAKQAADKLYTINSLHFLLDIKSGRLELYQGVTLKRAEGDYSKLDRLRAKLRVSVALAQLDAEIVEADGEQFLLISSFSRNWITLPPDVGFKGEVFFDPQTGLGAVVNKINNLQQVGIEKIDGVEVYHLRGVVAGPDIASITASLLGENEVDLDVWIGKNDFLLRQVIFKENSTEITAANLQLNFSRFNEPVEIKKPLVVSPGPTVTAPAKPPSGVTPSAAFFPITTAK